MAGGGYSLVTHSTRLVDVFLYFSLYQLVALKRRQPLRACVSVCDCRQQEVE